MAARGAFALGVSFGATASLSNSGSSQLAVVVSLLLGAGWAWAGPAVTSGWLQATDRSGTRRGPFTARGDNCVHALDSVLREEPFGLYQQELHRWWLSSAICGPLLGVVGAYVQRPGVRGLLAALTVPAGALVQMVVYPPGAGNLIVTFEMRLAQAIVLIGSGLVAVAALMRFLAEQRRRAALRRGRKLRKGSTTTSR